MAQTSRTSVVAFSALVLLAAGAAYAAGIDAQARKDYGRINFTFDAPATMRASSSGKVTTLSFNTPVTQSPEAIVAALPGYVSAAALSDDKKTLTLTLTKPYRMRQFTSGNRVGLDLIGQGDASAKATASAPAAQEALLTTKKPAATTPKPAAKEKPQATAKPTAREAILSTKKPAAVVAAKATPIPKPAPATEAMLTTKAEPAPAPAAEEVTLPVLSTKPPEAASTPAAPAEQATREEPAAAAPEPAAPAPAEVAAPAPAPEAEKPAAPSREGTNFTVSVKAEQTQTQLTFPWSERTAAAVFKRGQDIWLVFSRFADVNASQISKHMPKSVVKVVQYGDANNTIIRLMTDGSLHARVLPTSEGFAWHVALTAAPAAPQQDVSLSVDSLDGTQRVILGVYDVAPSLRFFDPAIGDQLIILPAYEVGRAVSLTKNFPQFSLLGTAQGVVLVSRLSDLNISQSRAGTILSAEGGLAVSENLPVLVGKAPVAGNATSLGVMLPYDQWYVPPEKFIETLHERLHAISIADKTSKPDALLELVKLYLGYGMGQEAIGPLTLIREQFPHYYSTNRLALLSGVANILAGHIDTATNDFASPELDNSDEAVLWRQVTALFTPPMSEAQKIQDAIQASTATSDSSANSANAVPTPEAAAAITASKPGLQFHKYSRPFIRFYPPRIRQKLATLAADAYLADGQEEKALAVYDTLLRDDILTPLKQEAEFALGAVAQKKGDVDQALEAYDRVAAQIQDPRSAARARAAAAMLRFEQGKLKADEAAELIEQARTSWRGDAIEREMLKNLVLLYTESKQYDNVLRTQKTILEAFPGDSEALTISGEMGIMFRRVFLEGLADEMDPLKALSLFYEFLELTPLSNDGDMMIQKLADRLAALDLLDRATALLDKQITSRSKGESRSRIGARLALLHLLNQNPKNALQVLEVTNYGNNAPELQTTRLQLMAEALTKMNKHEEALGVIYNDTTPTGNLLRLDILWAMRDWPNIVNRAEDILSARPNLTDPLTLKETEVLLKLALAYTFEGDYTQLRYLRDYYSGLIPDTAYRQIFDFITNDTAPLDTEDFNLLAQQISRTEGFLDTFKSKIAAGKLSEAVK